MTVPAHVLAAVRSIPHPRQEPDMTAPFPSPAEQAVIDRFGIFEPEERGLPPASSDLAWMDDLERAHAEFMPDWWGRMPTATVTDLLDAFPTLIAELRKRDAALRAVEALAVAQGDDSYVMTYALRAALAAHLAPATPPAQEDTDA